MGEPARPTPGPWTATLHHIQDYGGRTHAFINARGLVPLAAVVLSAEGCSQSEGRANAHLIAAAPELYAALAAFMFADGHDDFEDQWPAARAAIAKAEGSR